MQEEITTKKILVVDDEVAIRTMLRLTLVRAGYDVTEAENGEDALLMVHESKPHLVLLDVMMPGMDGFSVCEQLRKDPGTADLPIIIFSARTDRRSREKGERVGATKYLTKPMAPEHLLHHVEEVLA